ncbi:MAG: hypothetical protein LQ338_004216 [Usnochroma carphineum]|nr:MAG: hypothetical protein LQ338_004216 [Usnochroma carphineum]
MSTWGRFWPSGGRYSPFAATPSQPPPTVTEADYHYLGPDDIDPPSHYHNDNYGVPPRISRADSSNVPDILVLKHRGTTYPLHFPAYAIADGAVTVGEVRRLAARETKTDDLHRIKLLYKGKVLRDDSRPCRDEGLKQNSEILCVVSEAPSHNQQSSSSASEDEMIENGIGGGPRVDVDGTIIRDEQPRRSRRKGHRGGRKKKPSTPKDSSTYLSAPEAPYTSHHHRDDRSPSRNRDPSPAAAPPRPTPSPVPPQPQTSKPGKLTPSETLDALASRFHTEFVPQCRSYMSNPPSDAKTRDFEYKKLSETILAQIILKLDAVETEGDEGLRAKRKELVRETQAMLGSLDKVGKAGGA